MVHNKLPVQERLFRIQLARDPYCKFCLSACIQDVSHFFRSCDIIKIYWDWLRRVCLNLLGIAALEDDSLLMFQWPRSRKDPEVACLIGHYVYEVWEMVFTRGQNSINEREFFGYMRYKFKEAVDLKVVTGGAL